MLSDPPAQNTPADAPPAATWLDIDVSDDDDLQGTVLAAKLTPAKLPSLQC